jgi:hypothetical protein
VNGRVGESKPVKLALGQSLHSVYDEATFVVVRVPRVEVTVTCGGVEMLTFRPATHEPRVDSAGDDRIQLGKRYVDDDQTVELLCVKPGGGPVAVNGAPLRAKVAKPLPASD